MFIAVKDVEYRYSRVTGFITVMMFVAKVSMLEIKEVF